MGLSGHGPKRIIAIIGSYRKMETYKVLEQFERALKGKMDVEFEHIVLKDRQIGQCRGCFLCLTRGEELCPIKDGSSEIIQSMRDADGVIFATPNYALQVTAIMKNFLDRMAYTFHRPTFFHERFTCIVTQGATGGAGVVKYLRNVAEFTGFIYVKGFHVTTVSPRTMSEQKRIDDAVEAAASRYARSFLRTDSPRPSMKMIFVFRLVRSMYRTDPNYDLKDVRYFRDNGWFGSTYYYPVRIGPIGGLVGMMADHLGKHLALKRKKELGSKG